VLWVNGICQDYIPVTDRGLQYGDGLFETLEIWQGHPLFWQAHLSRLLEGCSRLHIQDVSIDILTAEVKLACANVENFDSRCVLKLIITRGSGGRGYRQPDTVQPTRIISLHPYPYYSADYQTEGIIARFCQTRLGLNSTLAGIKHLNRLEQVMARTEWDGTNIQEGLMLDSNGHVVEGTMSNVFYIQQGVVYTPDISQAGVAGIIRGIVIALAQAQGIPLIIKQLVSKEILLAADEVFVTNSIIGIWPVRQLEHRIYGIGPLTRQLQGMLNQHKQEELLQGRQP
jgi:4-amino-4-deoxychorismate lyase